MCTNNLFDVTLVEDDSKSSIQTAVKKFIWYGGGKSVFLLLNLV